MRAQMLKKAVLTNHISGRPSLVNAICKWLAQQRHECKLAAGFPQVVFVHHVLLSALGRLDTANGSFFVGQESGVSLFGERANAPLDRPARAHGIHKVVDPQSCHRWSPKWQSSHHTTLRAITSVGLYL